MQKNPRYQLVNSRDIDDQRILQSEWTRMFWPTTCEAGFSQIRVFPHNHNLSFQITLILKNFLKSYF